MDQETESFKGNLNINTPTESFDFSSFFEKSLKLPAGLPHTYGATPLDRMVTLQSQINLAIELQELTYRNIPDDVPMEIVDYVHTTFAARFHGRAEANEENYMTALYPKETYAHDQRILDMFERGELGQASPSELLLIRKLRGIRSVELACVTHPYGERIKDELPEMRDVVKQHVEMLDGTYFKDPDTKYRVKELVSYARGVGNDLQEGLLMTRKRTLGEMPDGTIIKERSSFVMRLDAASPFTGYERTAMEAVDLSTKGWEERLVEAGTLDEAASVLLDMDEFSFAIPISTTIYAYNRETAKEIKVRDEKTKAQQRALFAQHSPEMAHALNQARSLKVAEDRGGIYYVGPRDYSESD